jgi:uncharacterized protein YgbK (DUF1537 family)
MNEIVRLAAAAGLGAAIATGFSAIAAPSQQNCAASDLTRINKRFDDLEQALVALQTQSANAATSDAAANTSNQQLLNRISSQVADLNSTVVGLSGRIR